jgi:hypothetical protein
MNLATFAFFFAGKTIWLNLSTQRFKTKSMKFSILFILMPLLCSCKEKQDKKITNDQFVQSADSISLQNKGRKTLYIERAHLELGNYSFAIQTIFDIPDTIDYDSSLYSTGNFLFIRDKKNDHLDSLKLEIDFYAPANLELKDFTDSLHFKSLVLCVSWSGNSDQPGSEFVEYDGESLEKLFTIDNLVSLERKDEWTLSGFVAGRDEVVYSGQDDYPITISLKDYKIHTTIPDKQSIGYATVALEDLKAYRSQKLNDRSVFLIRKGRELIVDSIYRSQKLVRLIVEDSIILYQRPDVISKTVQHNTAG